MSRDRETGTATAPLDEIYRRVGRVHYALATADRVDAGLQGRCMSQLMDVLRLIEVAQAGEKEGAATT